LLPRFQQFHKGPRKGQHHIVIALEPPLESARSALRAKQRIERTIDVREETPHLRLLETSFKHPYRAAEVFVEMSALCVIDAFFERSDPELLSLLRRAGREILAQIKAPSAPR